MYVCVAVACKKDKTILKYIENDNRIILLFLLIHNYWTTEQEIVRIRNCIDWSSVEIFVKLYLQCIILMSYAQYQCITHNIKWFKIYKEKYGFYKEENAVNEGNYSHTVAANFMCVSSLVFYHDL